MITSKVVSNLTVLPAIVAGHQIAAMIPGIDEATRSNAVVNSVAQTQGITADEIKALADLVLTILKMLGVLG